MKDRCNGIQKTNVDLSKEFIAETRDKVKAQVQLKMYEDLRGSQDVSQGTTFRHEIVTNNDCIEEGCTEDKKCSPCREKQVNAILEKNKNEKERYIPARQFRSRSSLGTNIRAHKDPNMSMAKSRSMTPLIDSAAHKDHLRSASASNVSRHRSRLTNENVRPLDYFNNGAGLYMGQNLEITFEDNQLFARLKKMVDACVKMECLGCHKLIPTVQFFEHLIETDEDDQPICQMTNEDDHMVLNFESQQQSIARPFKMKSSDGLKEKYENMMH